MVNNEELKAIFALGTVSGQPTPTKLEKRFSPGGEFYNNTRSLSAQEKLGIVELPKVHNVTPNLKG
jgi:hypothetical protein